MPSRRILLVMIEPPLPFGNAAGRWYHVLYRGLVERGHHVTAFATYGKADDADLARSLFPPGDFDLRLYPENVRPGLRSKWNALRRPYSYLFSPALQADFDRELAKGFDVLHLEHIWSARLALKHRAKALPHVHYLFGIDQAEVTGGSLVDRVRRALTLRAERRLLKTFPRISTLTPRLSDAVSTINPSAEVTTIPLGMDATLYPFQADPTESERPPTVGLIGSFGWRPTHSAGVRLLTRLWPEIRRRVPQARLRLVGRKARAALGDLAQGDGIDVFEDVPETESHFRAIDVMLYAPARGSGMKVKVLEAFALGTAVVTTSEGVEGLPAIDGVHCGVAEDDPGLIDRPVALLQNVEKRRACRVAARTLLETHCGPKSTLDAVEAVHERVASGRLLTPSSTRPRS